MATLSKKEYDVILDAIDYAAGAHEEFERDAELQDLVKAWNNLRSQIKVK